MLHFPDRPSPDNPDREEKMFQFVCKTDEIPEGTAKMFVIEGAQVGIFHVNGQFFALDNRCPHAGASLANGLIQDETVYCRIHYWQFNLRDGKRIDDACPNSDARSLPVRVVDQEVQVEIA